MSILQLLRRVAQDSIYGGDSNQASYQHGEGFGNGIESSTTSSRDYDGGGNARASITTTSAATAAAYNSGPSYTREAVSSPTTASGIPGYTSSPSTTNTATAAATTTLSSTSISTTTAVTHSSGGLSTTTKLAIAIPVAVVGALIILGIIFFFLRRRRQQRNTTKAAGYEVAKDQPHVVSTSQLMITVPTSRPQPEPSLPRFPMLDLPDSRDGEITPGTSTDHMSGHEMGFGMAISNDPRSSTTEQDLRGISRSASPANAVESQLRAQNDARDDDAVSVVSHYHDQSGTREHDYDDLSSVSSFGGDSSRLNDHQHPFS
ncbi:hypothetical protein N7540_002405 [Penicillium herquei]|nr:hypothetical protein N7540_002405 [Penicillium herquei]